MLEYASKFIEVFHFSLAFRVNERLKMNCFVAKLNPDIKGEDVGASVRLLRGPVWHNAECGEGDEGKEQLLRCTAWNQVERGPARGLPLSRAV